MMVYIDQDFKSIIPAYLENIRKQLSLIESLSNLNRFKDIEKIAMQLRDSGRNYGFVAIGELGIKIMYFSGLEYSNKILEAVGELKAFIDSCEIRYIEL